MINYSRLKMAIAAACISFLMISCGDDETTVSTVNYGGNTSDASFTMDNSDEILQSGTESITKSVDSEKNAPDNPFAAVSSVSSSKLSDLLLDIVTDLSETATPSLINATLSSDALNSATNSANYCGGSLSFPNSVLTNTTTFNGTFTFNNLCVVDPTGGSNNITINGSMTITTTGTSTSISYNNMSVTQAGVTHTFSATVACINGTSCSISSDYVGFDGKIYRVTDFTVSGDSNNGFMVSAIFYHPDHGKISISTSTPILFSCDNGHPSAGTLNFNAANGSNGSVSVTYDSCTAYSYNYTLANGSTGSGTGTWPTS